MRKDPEDVVEVKSAESGHSSDAGGAGQLQITGSSPTTKAIPRHPQQ